MFQFDESWLTKCLLWRSWPLEIRILNECFLKKKPINDHINFPIKFYHKIFRVSWFPLSSSWATSDSTFSVQTRGPTIPWVESWWKLSNFIHQFYVCDAIHDRISWSISKISSSKVANIKAYEIVNICSEKKCRVIIFIW
jgi:hypothetical protein